MLPEYNKKRSNNEVRIEKKDNFLKEQLSNTTQALRGATDKNKKLDKELKKEQKRKKYANIAFVICAAFAVYSTTLYYQQQNTPIAYQVEQPKNQNLPLPEVKTPKPKIVKQAVLKTPKKTFKRTLKQVRKPAKTKQKANKETFAMNEVLEDRIQKGRKTSLSPAQLDKVVNIGGNSIVIAFKRGTSLVDHSLTLLLRNNDPFAEPLKKKVLGKKDDIQVIHKKDLLPGLYYIEIIESKTLKDVFSSKFTVKK